MQAELACAEKSAGTVLVWDGPHASVDGVVAGQFLTAQDRGHRPGDGRRACCAQHLPWSDSPGAHRRRSPGRHARCSVTGTSRCGRSGGLRRRSAFAVRHRIRLLDPRYSRWRRRPCRPWMGNYRRVEINRDSRETLRALGNCLVQVALESPVTRHPSPRWLRQAHPGLSRCHRRRIRLVSKGQFRTFFA